MSDQIEANYEVLDQVVQQFQELEAKAKTLRGRIIVGYHDIKDGHGWEGQGSKAFIDEMDTDILASTNNLVTALGEVARVVGRISQKFRESEEAARTGMQGMTPNSP